MEEYEATKEARMSARDERGGSGKGEGTRGALFLKFAWGIKARWLRSPAELLFADTECGGSKALCQAYVSLLFGNEWWEGREGSRKRDREKGETGIEKEKDQETVRNRAEGFAVNLWLASRKALITTANFRSSISRSLSLNRRSYGWFLSSTRDFNYLCYFLP